MKYLYDSFTLQVGDNPESRANQWGRNGWRWINPEAVSCAYREQHSFVAVTMRFEKVVDH